jgi:Tetracyclin repressor-like, C-terminal domain
MALYKHVANKEEMLDGMVDVVVGEVDPPLKATDWKTAIRERGISARRALLRHPWASRVIESRTDPTPTVIEYMDSLIGIFQAAGFSIDLTHHAMHAMGSRLVGFSQELFDDTPDDPPENQAIRCQQMADRYPHISEIVAAITHDDASVAGLGCNDQFEFEFCLDLMPRAVSRTRQILVARDSSLDRSGHGDEQAEDRQHGGDRGLDQSFQPAPRCEVHDRA